MTLKRNIIEIDEKRCTGCGACVSACAEGAIAVVNGKAQVVSDKYCDGLGECIGQCPQDALRIVIREAEPFDEEAAIEHMKGHNPRTIDHVMQQQCPSEAVRRIEPKGPQPASEGPQQSALCTWPVQLRLVPPHAAFLNGADLLVASDCTAFAYAGLHRDFIRGRVALTGCPKFDDRAMYVDKFAEIFKQNDIRSITVVAMDVPCCQGMPLIVKSGLKAAGKTVSLETVVVSVEGDIVERKKE